MTTTLHSSVVFDVEPNGVPTAYVAGLPVYAAADTRAQCERGIVDALTAHLAEEEAMPTPALVKTATVTRRAQKPPQVRLRSVAALLGATSSRRKAAAARVNGRKGGRPRTGDPFPIPGLDRPLETVLGPDVDLDKES